MGGLACILVVRSTLTHTSVPTDPKQLAEFDAQMRAIHFNVEYSQSLVNEAPESVKDVIEILEEPTKNWTTADRQKLLAVVNQICGGYPAS